MNEVINNNKYRLKYWFAMLYIHGRKFMIGSVFTYQRLSKDFITDLKNSLYYPLLYFEKLDDF